MASSMNDDSVKVVVSGNTSFLLLFDGEATVVCDYLKVFRSSGYIRSSGV